MIEKVVSGTLVVFSIVYLFMAKGLPFGSVSQPGVGFMPAIAGTMAMIISIINFISVMMKKDDKKAKKEDGGTAPELDILKLVKFAAGCLAYILMLDHIGFLISTLAVLVYLLKVTGVEGWISPILISAGTSLGFYFLFEKMLGVMLP